MAGQQGQSNEGGGSFWGRTLDWAFPVKSPEASTTNPPVSPSPVVSAGQQSVPVGAPAGVNVSTASSVDQQMYADLERTVFASNGLSPYLQLGTLLKALEGTLPDEALRYRSAFAAARAQGLDPGRVLQALRSHLAELDRQLNVFTTDADGRLARATETKQRGIAVLDQQVAAKSDEVRRLQAEIAKFAADKAQAEADLQAERSRMEDVKRRFHGAHSALRQRLADDEARVTRYSQGG